jgi:hypothetical protein
MSPNPEYYRWILINELYKFLAARLQLDKKVIERSMVLAFSNKQMRTYAADVKQTEQGTTAYQVRVHTHDALRWMALEFDLHNIKLSELFHRDEPGNLLALVFPHLDADWPELANEGPPFGVRLS